MSVYQAFARVDPAEIRAIELFDAPEVLIDFAKTDSAVISLAFTFVSDGRIFSQELQIELVGESDFFTFQEDDLGDPIFGPPFDLGVGLRTVRLASVEDGDLFEITDSGQTFGDFIEITPDDFTLDPLVLGSLEFFAVNNLAPVVAQQQLVVL